MNTLFSLGYSGVRLEAVNQWLDAHDALLVDVRFKPFSRNPEWRQPHLQRVLGSRYRWVRALGNLNYRGGPSRLVEEAEGVRIVVAMMESNPVVLTCICSDPRVCHRWTAANLISEATGAKIVHLRPSDFGPSEQLDLLTSYHRVTS